jgi:CheY-like chemotaxis protein
MRAMNRLLIIDTNKKNQDGITAMVSEIIKKSSIAPGVTNDKEGTISLSFQIDHAYRAKDALSKVKKAKEEDTPFALIIMDSTVLPGTDRVETITRIRETDPHAEILIYTSPQEYSWDAINNKPENCYHIIFLQKPVNPVELSVNGTRIMKQGSLLPSLNMKQRKEQSR